MNVILLVVQIILAVLLVSIILLQRSGSDGLGGLSGSGSNNGVVSSKASANFLTKATAILATLFMINSLVLGNLASKNSKTHSVFDKIVTEKNHKNHKNKNGSIKESTTPIVPEIN
jgi:preprotein translocase subunit SecG